MTDPFSLCRSQLQTLVTSLYSVHFVKAKVRQLSVTSENAIKYLSSPTDHALYGFLWVAYQSMYLVIATPGVARAIFFGGGGGSKFRISIFLGFQKNEYFLV